MALGRVHFSTKSRGRSTTQIVLCNARRQRETARVLTALDLDPDVTVPGAVIHHPCTRVLWRAHDLWEGELQRSARRHR
jgi:hypothetical protein